ncbi:MoxR family ATPase [Georgenia sp. 10Sc9-8]|uniref:MoxR family ATPase n=1 Tax=Georgenia halotolerans TaxID=3028317 RepID=A0ABT5U076_9MICO|nr:MoxR family ATPase [Georgenia halotolerans]
MNEMVGRRAGADQGYVSRTRSRIGERVVGRERELDLLLAAVGAGRDILLEGPPGTSKTTLLRAIATEWNIPLVFVEGNADLTPAKLLGHHDPARVLQEGYRDENFVDGPLLRAMREGGFLYIEEFNRAPDDTLNTLLTAMAEREVQVPRLGRLVSRPTFRVIASMNPHDNIGTTRLSTSVHDRFNRLSVTYQDEQAERDIVAMQATLPEGQIPAELVEVLRTDAVAVTRATRDHPDVRQGSSVRGAIDLTLVGAQLLAMRDITEAGGTGRVVPEDSPRRRYADTFYDAMVVALSGRIHLDEAVPTTPEAVLRQIWEDHFLLNPAAAEPG